MNEQVQTAMQIPPEAYTAVGMLIAVNLPALINFIKELFKTRTSDAVASALLAEQIKTLNQTLTEFKTETKADMQKVQKDIDAAFSMIRDGKNRGA